MDIISPRKSQSQSESSDMTDIVKMEQSEFFGDCVNRPSAEKADDQVLMSPSVKYNYKGDPIPINTESCPETPQEPQEYYVEAIVGRKLIKGMVHYLVKWKDYNT